jgi:hypothetical protein
MSENVIEKRSEIEGARTASEISDSVKDRVSVAETEVTWRQGKRKKYTESYKRQVIEHVAELRQTGSGNIGGYLRREGLYYTMIQKWEKKLKGKAQQQTDSGKSARERQLEKELEEAKKELKLTKKKLEKSEMIIEFQKKISILLNPDQEEEDQQKKD